MLSGRRKKDYAAESAYRGAQGNLERALIERTREMQLVDAARWHRRYDADVAADARTTPAQRANGKRSR